MPKRGSTPIAQSPGFTLIELLIVVVIIGLLAAIAIPGLLNALDKTKQTSSATMLRQFGVALELYNTDNTGYPLAADIHALMPHLKPYSDALKTYDSWKHDLTFVTSGDSYTIECLGKDGIDGIDISPETRHEFALDIVVADGMFIANVN